jgi:hypothetical protein
MVLISAPIAAVQAVREPKAYRAKESDKKRKIIKIIG